MALRPCRTVLTVADYTTANPNYGHYVLAMLILEGAITVMSSNWDDCIERAEVGERVHVIITDHDRLNTAIKALLKIHGCSRHPQTMLMTSAELSNPPAWVYAEMAARLADSHVVFVGIGDVAGYVEVRVREVVDKVGNVDHLRVVGPDVSSAWDGSDWATIVPSLQADHRIEMTADEFLDLLAGAYVATALLDIRDSVAGSSERVAAVDRFRKAAANNMSIFMLRWFRGAAVRPLPGETVLRSDAAAIGVIALGLLSADPLTLERHGVGISDSNRHQVLLAKPLQPRSELERDARHRLQQHIANAGPDEGAPTFVVCGGIGPLSTDAALPPDVIDEGDQHGMVEGPMVPTPTLIDGAMVVNQ